MRNNPSVVAALDSFKGALSSAEAGEAVRRGIHARLPLSKVTVFPVGDGGEGTAEALILCHGAVRHSLTVSDTHGAPVTAEYGMAGRTAFFDMASAAGLRFAKEHGLDLMRSSTYGVGEMIRGILSAEPSCAELMIGLGGSGTEDGGIGALTALGGKFIRSDGSLIERPTTASLAELASCDLSAARNLLNGRKLTLLYDSGVPLTGSSGATMLYARQKGATEEMLLPLEDAMRRYAGIAGQQDSEQPGAGAAGGLGFGLSLIGGILTPGAEAVLASIEFDGAVREADLVITGEGRTDRQTATGKLPLAVARHAHGTPVVCLCGSCETLSPTDSAVLREGGIDAVLSIADGPLTLGESMARTADLLEKTAFQLAGLMAKRR